MNNVDFTRVSHRDGAEALDYSQEVQGSPWQTLEGIPIKRRYSSADLARLDHVDYLSGLPPFLRGPYCTMYAVRPWTIRQYAGFSTAEESNAVYRRNLALGQKASIARPGYPPGDDHPRAGRRLRWRRRGPITTCGPVRGIPDQMSVSMTMNGAACRYELHPGCRRAGVPHDKLIGTIQNDIPKIHGPQHYIYPPPVHVIVADIFAYTCQYAPVQLHLDLAPGEAGAT